MARSNKFGTFGGVFTPSILTILGVIMYLRLPMIVGQAGLYATIGIIVVAHIISITTGLSVSSIATDKKVQAGGTYYMISRSLGLPIGGTLGLALFVGLSFSVSLYLIGFSESFLGFWGFEITKDNIRLAGSAILLVVAIITFISTSLALKTQYFIMAAIFLSLLSIFFGKHEFSPSAPLLPNPASTIPLMALFGIFFPAVTGFEAGVSMSGDLKDPKKSIPMGSISAIVVGLVVYILLAVFLSYTVDGESLAKDPKVLLKISRIPELVIAGIWGATLSSALGSILGAPRILQATATDKITHRIFARGTGKTNEPRNALLLTFVIAEAGILIGELNVIARIVSIFFITTYGFLNLSCAFERLTSADFRPAFKTPAWISILGSAACIIVMIQLDFVAMLAATILLGAVYFLIKRKQLVLQTGDAWSSLWASLVRSGLKRLQSFALQNRNWRPNIIMFSGDEEERPWITWLGKDIAGKLGILTGFNLETNHNKKVKLQQKEAGKDNQKFFLNHHLCQNIYTGMDEIIRVFGFNGIEPNTVLMGWSKDPNNRDEFMGLIKQLQKNNLSSIFVNHNYVDYSDKTKTIDIWWSGRGHNLSFAIGLIRHLTSSSNWNDPKTRIFVEVRDSSQIEIAYNSLENILSDFRVEMEIKVINNSLEKTPFHKLVQNESANTDLTIIGLNEQMIYRIENHYDDINKLLEKTGATILISASNQFEEFNILREKEDYNISKRNEKSTDMPPFAFSKYAILNEWALNFDKNGMLMLEAFYDKTFMPFFREQTLFLDEIISIPEKSIKEVGKLAFVKEKYRTVKILNKIRGELYTRLKDAIGNFVDKKLLIQKNLLASGLEKYISDLSGEALRCPKKITINYDKADFRINKTDHRRLKWLKRKKAILRHFAKQNIKGKIKLRKAAKYYLEQNRIQHLNEYLIQINQLALKLNFDIKALLSSLNQMIDNIKADIDQGRLNEKQCDDQWKSIKANIEETKLLIDKKSLQLKQDLLSEFRKNMQLFLYDIEKIDLSHVINKKKRSKGFYRETRESNLSYPGNWHENAHYLFNKLLLDLMVAGLKNKTESESLELFVDTSRLINVEMTTKLENFRKNLVELRENNDKNIVVPDIKLSSSFFNAEEYFDMLNKKIVECIDDLPEEIKIYNKTITGIKDLSAGDLEIMEVPVRRMARHFLDSLLIGELDNELDMVGAEIRKKTYQVKDHLGFLHFEMENIAPDLTDKKSETLKITDHFLENLENDIDDIKKIDNGLHHFTFQNIVKTFEPLSPHKITESTRELSHILREFQGKKTMGRFEHWYENTKHLIKRLTVRVLYSKSEGILFARELADDQKNITGTNHFLDLIDEVSPSPNIQNHIPSYYKNLFSGRSSIGEDFWIERRSEEKQFEKALDHYKEGYKGGILVLGERNSGKTAFCRHITRRHFQTTDVYHIFPPLQDSFTMANFDEVCQNIFEMKGSAREILEKLPYNKTVILHDLELWWELSEKGFALIESILDLIRQFRDKILFVVNMNIYSFQKIIEVKPDMPNSFITNIVCTPFDSEDLKELIMRRHRSGGIKFKLGKRYEDNLSEIRIAGLFNKYFNYSSGNPGLALYGWLKNIRGVGGETIDIGFPEKINTAAFDNLDEDHKVVLYQMVLHKRMGIKKLKNVLQLEEKAIVDIAEALLLSGLIKEKSNGIYMINPYLDKFLADYLVLNQ